MNEPTTPIPLKIQGIFLLTALLLALGFSLYSSYRHPPLKDDQINLGSMDNQEADPTLYNRDYLFQDNSFYHTYQPVFRGMLRFARKFTGSFENGLIVLVGVGVFLYAYGWSWLSWRLTGSVWAALFFAFITIPYRVSPPGEIWGLGTPEGFLGRTPIVAISPYLFLMMFAWLQRPDYLRGIILGAATGLTALIHPLPALHLAELFLGLFLLNYGLSRRGWLAAAAMGLTFGALAFLPGTQMKQQAAAALAGVSFAEFRQVMQEFHKLLGPSLSWQEPFLRHVTLFVVVFSSLGLHYLLRPKSQKPQALLHLWLGGGLTVLYLGWRIAGKGAGLTWLYLSLAWYIIYCFRQRRLEKLDWWLWGWGVLTVGLYLLSTFGLTWLWWRWDTMALNAWVAEHRRVARLIHPFSYLMGVRAAVLFVDWCSRRMGRSQEVVQGGYSLLALCANQPWWLGWAGATITGYEAWRRLGRGWKPLGSVLLALALLTGGYLTYRQGLPSLAGAYAEQLGHGLWVTAEEQDQIELAAWARENTPKEALFFHGSPLFRYLSRRSITHSNKDLGNYYDPKKMVELYHRYHYLQGLPASPEQLVAAARSLGADYLVIKKNPPVCLPFTVVFETTHYFVFQLPKTP